MGGEAMGRGFPIAVLALCAVLGACGSGAAPSSASTPDTPSCPAEGGVGCEVGSPMADPVRGCGAVTADLVTSALDTPAHLIGQDDSGCGFTAGRWSLGVRAEPYDPTTQSGATQRFVNNDRSGLWQAHGGVLVDGVLYTYWLRNSATGADTYPGFEGPKQESVTAAAAASLEDAINRAGEPDRPEASEMSPSGRLPNPEEMSDRVRHASQTFTVLPRALGSARTARSWAT
jgi:hypothetical protein